MLIRNKLALGVWFNILLFVVLGVYFISQVATLGGLTVKMYNHPLNVTRATLSADAGIVRMHRSMKDVALAGDQQTIQMAVEQVAGYEREVYQQLDVVTEWILGQEGEQLIAETIGIFRQWKPIRDEVIALMQAGDRHAAAEITKGKGAQHVAKLTDQMTKLENYAATKASGFLENAQQTRSSAQALTIGLVFSAVVIALISSIWLIRSITKPIDDFKQVIDTVERSSDLSERVNIHSRDELGAIVQSFNKMQDKLQKTIHHVTTTTAQQAAATEQMAAISEQTREGVTQQCTETDQVVTATNEMSATVQEVARSAVRAAEAARNAETEVSNSGKEVKEAINAITILSEGVDNIGLVMNEVQTESENIGTVLNVIEGIAEQTNLLALNAAIEAARAGEQGRGFAVVADEVRLLAQRTQESTAQIQETINRLHINTLKAVETVGENSGRAQASVEQAARAITSLDAITQAIGTITEMNTQIASASGQQSQVATEINESIVCISEVNARTAKGAEQSAQSSQQLKDLSAELQALVGEFKA